MYKSVGMFRCCSQTLISSSFPLKKSLKMLYLHVCAILWIMMFFCDIHRVVCTWRPSHCQCSQIILLPICLSMQGLLIVNCMWHHFWRTTPSVDSLDRTVFWLIFSLYQSGFSCCIKHTLQVKTEETVADLRHRPLEALVIFHIGPELQMSNYSSLTFVIFFTTAPCCPLLHFWKGPVSVPLWINYSWDLTIQKHKRKWEKGGERLGWGWPEQAG